MTVLSVCMPFGEWWVWRCPHRTPRTTRCHRLWDGSFASPHGWSSYRGLEGRPQLERRNLVIDLRSVIQVAVVLAGGREEELDAVTPHAVVTREQRDVAFGPDLAPGVRAALHPDDDLHDVPRVTPHLCGVRVVDQVVLDRHDDQAIGLVGDTEDLAEDPGHGIGIEIDVTVAASVAAGRSAYRRARVEAPGRSAIHDWNLGAVLGRVAAGRSGHTDEREQGCHHEGCES